MKLLRLYLLAGVSLAASVAAQAFPLQEHLLCHLTSRGSRGVLQTNAEVRLVITASVRPFKHLNTLFPHEGTEHVANVLHLTFQRRMLDQLNWLIEDQVVGGSSIMAKIVDRVIYVPVEAVEATLESLREAKHLAARDAAEYLLYQPGASEPEVVVLLNANTRRPGVNAIAGRYILGEGQSQLDPISPEVLQQVRNHYRQTYSSINALTEYLIANLGIGVGSHAVDSHASANMAAANPKLAREVVMFDFATFQTHLAEAREYRASLQPLFQNKNDNDLLQLFADFRKNIAKMAIEQTTPAFRDILAQLHLARTGVAPSESDLPFLMMDIERYIRALNILDFLPIETIVVDPTARSEFESFGPWRGALYGDILRLGASNLLLMHHALDTIISITDNIAAKSKERDRLEEASPDAPALAALENELFELREQLNLYRMRMLNDTGEFVNRIHAELFRVLAELGIPAENFRAITYGDDFFLVWNNKVDPKVVAHRIKTNRLLGDRLRIGAMRNRGVGATLTLGQARNSVGLTGEALKVLESNLGTQFVIEVDRHQDGKIKAELLIVTETKLVPARMIFVDIASQYLPLWSFQ